jgi:hypothetical protein
MECGFTRLEVFERPRWPRPHYGSSPRAPRMPRPTRENPALISHLSQEPQTTSVVCTVRRTSLEGPAVGGIKPPGLYVNTERYISSSAIDDWSIYGLASKQILLDHIFEVPRASCLLASRQADGLGHLEHPNLYERLRDSERVEGILRKQVHYWSQTGGSTDYTAYTPQGQVLRYSAAPGAITRTACRLCLLGSTCNNQSLTQRVQ